MHNTNAKNLFLYYNFILYIIQRGVYVTQRIVHVGNFDSRSPSFFSLIELCIQ